MSGRVNVPCLHATPVENLNILYRLFPDRLNAQDDKFQKLMNTFQRLVQEESRENEVQTVLLERMCCFTYDRLTEL